MTADGESGAERADGGATVEAADPTADTDDTYRGVFGAFPYAFRVSDAGLFRSYVIVGGLVAAAVTLIFGFALVTLVANTVGTAGGSFTFVRAFYIVVGLAVVAPLVAPVLSVARRHRRSGSDATYDAAVAASGYLFVVALYLSLVVTAPADTRADPPAVLAPAVEVLYAAPPAAGAVPPLLAVLLGYLVHRHYR